MRIPHPAAPSAPAWCAASTLFAALAAACAAPAPVPAPVPLVDLEFSCDLRNAGTLGGEGAFVTCAPGQGPAFGPGARGTGLSLAASARGGGSDNTRAGGAVRLKVPGLGGRDPLTLALWFRPIGPNAPARLLYLAPCWDLHVAGATVALKIRHARRDVAFAIPAKQIAFDPDGWNFLAVTLERDARRARFFHGREGATPRLVATWEQMPRIDTGEAELEIGNLGGIRPFRGLMDSVRVLGAVLTPDQLSAEAGAGRRAPRSLRDSLSSAPRLSDLYARSDVCLSSRWKHRDSIDAIRAFGANRLLWTYAVDRPFADACRATGVRTYQGAINSLPGTAESAAHALDFDGHPVVAPWMVAFNRTHPVYWGCNNRKRFLEISVQRACRALEAGADSLQFDDWSLVASAASWGGACFCGECMAAFRDDVSRHATRADLDRLGIGDPTRFDYRDFLRTRHGIDGAAAYARGKRALPTTPLFDAFQRRSVRAFFIELRHRIDAAAGRRVPLSINATLIDPTQQRGFIADLVDSFQGETLRFPIEEIALGARVAEALGKWQVFVPESLETAEVRAGIATAYAMGQLPLVPWDMYMGSDATGVRPRGYGTPAQYGDLYRFAHAHPALLDARETAATVALIVDMDRPVRTRALAACRRLLDAQTPFAVVPVGHAFFDVPLRAARLAGFDLVVTVGDTEQWTRDDLASLREAARDAAVIDSDLLTDEFCRRCAPFELWGPASIHILPRLDRDPTDKTLVCHVINRATPGRDLRWLSFVIRPQARLGARLAAALWHTPEHAPAPIEWEELDDGRLRILLPRVPLWGVAELKFEDGPCQGRKSTPGESNP